MKKLLCVFGLLASAMLAHPQSLRAGLNIDVAPEPRLSLVATQELGRATEVFGSRYSLVALGFGGAALDAEGRLVGGLALAVPFGAAKEWEGFAGFQARFEQGRPTQGGIFVGLARRS